VLRLCNRGAQPVWGAEEYDAAYEVYEGMLTGKFETIRTNAGLDEDASIMVKAFQSVSHPVEHLHRVSGSPREIAEIEKRRYAAHHIVGHMSRNSRKKDLCPKSKNTTKRAVFEFESPSSALSNHFQSTA
jgi:hypothetical protein